MGVNIRGEESGVVKGLQLKHLMFNVACCSPHGERESCRDNILFCDRRSYLLDVLKLNFISWFVCIFFVFF